MCKLPKMHLPGQQPSVAGVCGPIRKTECWDYGKSVLVLWWWWWGQGFAVSIWHVGSRLIVQGATNPCRHYISASESRVWVRARCGGNVAWRAPYITIYIASTSSLHQPVAIFVLHNPSSAPHHNTRHWLQPDWSICLLRYAVFNKDLRLIYPQKQM